MSKPRKIEEAATVRELRAKAALFDELVEALARSEDELERFKAQPAVNAGVDPAWWQIANDLASALRPYTLLSLRATGNASVRPASRVEDIVVDCGCGNSRSVRQRLEQRAPAQVAGARTAINRRKRNSRSAACRR